MVGSGRRAARKFADQTAVLLDKLVKPAVLARINHIDPAAQDAKGTTSGHTERPFVRHAVDAQRQSADDLYTAAGQLCGKAVCLGFAVGRAHPCSHDRHRRQLGIRQGSAHIELLRYPVNVFQFLRKLCIAGADIQFIRFLHHVPPFCSLRFPHL